MKLNESKGNMYEFITHTWNPIKGKCYHDCKYCYMKGINPNPTSIHLADNEFIGSFPANTFIFVDSSADLFAVDVPDEWINRVLDFCYNNTEHFQPSERPRFLIQTKNPARILDFINHPLLAPERQQVVACTTIETNRHYPDIMNNAPLPLHRAEAMAEIAKCGIKTYVTIEPIMDFDLDEMVALIKMCKPEQVNIGANTYRTVELPEPNNARQLINLILQLLCFTHLKIKKNLDGEKLTKALIRDIKDGYSYEKRN